MKKKDLQTQCLRLERWSTKKDDMVNYCFMCPKLLNNHCLKIGKHQSVTRRYGICCSINLIYNKQTLKMSYQIRFITRSHGVKSHNVIPIHIIIVLWKASTLIWHFTDWNKWTLLQDFVSYNSIMDIHLCIYQSFCKHVCCCSINIMKVKLFHQQEAWSPIVIHYLSSHGLILQLALTHHADPKVAQLQICCQFVPTLNNQFFLSFLTNITIQSQHDLGAPTSCQNKFKKTIQWPWK